MKINPDCIRDLLIDIENTTTFNKQYVMCNDTDSDLTDKYSYDVVLYHSRYCYEAKLLTSYTPFDSGQYFIVADLSPDGHAFLENIRNNTNWNKVKNALKSAGTYSLKLMIETAAQIASTRVISSLGI